MLQIRLLMFLPCLAAFSAERGATSPRYAIRDKVNYNKHEKNKFDLEGNVFYRKGHEENLPSTSPRPLRREMVIEKFVESLMSSERYLRMIETVERKINHLDATFHERTNTILKYVSELMRLVKAESLEVTDSVLRTIKADIGAIKMTAARPVPKMEGADFHADPSLDARLASMEGQVKSIMSSVESIVTIISEVKTRQTSRTQRPEATALDAMTLISEFRKSLHDQKRKCDCKSGRVDRTERYPTDCHEIQMQGFNVSGIYKIKPEDMEPFYVLCDLTTAGGGWTVLQNRFDGSQDFYKGWYDYKNGFGNLAGEFWLGLEKFNYLTNQKLYELRVEIEAQSGHEAFAGYSVFTVGPEHEGFRISTLGTYHGTAGDSLSYHAGQKFSTLDADNDEWKDGACAVEHGGAWWYKECDKSNLNGKYSTTADEHRGQSMYWISFKGPNFPLIKTKMMIRPLPASRPNELSDPTRKIPESSNMRPTADKLRAPAGAGPDRKTKYDPARLPQPQPQPQPPYRFENHADAFFPGYI